MVVRDTQWMRVASLAELSKSNCLTVSAEGHTVVLFKYGDAVYAVDNRCPHMGFPLNKGTVKDGILTCHWHHARFDLASGGTFDLWADDVPAFPVEVEGDDILINFTTDEDRHAHHLERVRDGLEQQLSLVVAKSVIGLANYDGGLEEAFREGLTYGTTYRGDGWGRGLTTHGCFVNLLPYLHEDDKPRAMYHGLTDVANDTMGTPHHPVGTLPNKDLDAVTLKRWLRGFIEVRDTQAAQRVVNSAVQSGMDDKQMADMLFAAATDHRYLDLGHTLDFINKAFESLDLVGWEYAQETLASVVPLLTGADRMEESSSWRNPIDLVEILEDAFKTLPETLETGASQDAQKPDFDALVPMILADDPQATVDALVEALRSGVRPVDLAGVVAYAAAIRIAQFHTSNEFGDWDTALHTFTFANAVHMGLRRVNSAELVRGIFDGAMSVYLDRFLNIPTAKIPEANDTSKSGADILTDLENLLNQQQRVNQAAQMVANYLATDANPDALLAVLGKLLLREDRNFHTIQCVEAGFRQYKLLSANPDTEKYANNVLIAVARYLAAHAPTMRAQGQTYQLAHRLSRGEALFEG